MNNSATKSDIERLSQENAEIVNLLRTFMDHVSQKLEDHDEQFRKLNKNYDHLIQEIAQSSGIKLST